MTNLDEGVYSSEEQFNSFLIVAPDDRQNFSMMMATSGMTITGLGADGTTWMALGPVRDSGHAASGNQMSYFNTTC